MTAVALIGATVASYAVAWQLAVPAAVPFLNALAGYPFMVACIRAGLIRRAIALMLTWAITMGVCATGLAWARPATTARLFVNAAAYEREMFTWIATGEGRESRPSEFLTQHAAHAAIFSGLSLATGSALSMPVGAALMNYMGHYVGALARHGASSWLVLAGWHPWALIRITSFVILGVVLSTPVLCAVFRVPWQLTSEARRWLAIAATGLAVDVILKASLAPVWNRLLNSLAGW